ncbi:MAG: SDR family NAD(P)-dependent oxidoreductase, partial [Pseudonocardia sp.]|nr:SDR family NAD(P)-dependent oxidoreductase [Pseudonocardia sp.]
MGRVDGKVALITGAARGQGRSHAVTLAREGAEIVALDLAAQIESVPYALATPDDLAETARLVEDLDRRVITQQADVRDPDAMRGAVERGLSE